MNGLVLGQALALVSYSSSQVLQLGVWKTMEEVKGVVRFSSRVDDKFRFSMSRSRIWLENHKTKHQW